MLANNYGGSIPTIPEYFADKTIFITGGGGFIGKLLVEKLLRSCPKLKRIYLLLRNKKGVDAKTRLDNVFKMTIFESIRKSNPKLLNKAEVVEGDVTLPDLGLSDENWTNITEETDIVFHIAANVRFDASLRSALLLNTNAALNVITFASKMKRIAVYLHVSTTYCQSDKRIIEEKVYPPPADWKSMLKLAETVHEHELEVFKDKILGSLPNTYTFSKSLAEHVVNDHRSLVPGLIIFRPSIVISTMDEPVPGWMDNFNGPVSLILAMAKGIVRSVHVFPQIRADYIPADLAVKAMITSVWSKGTNGKTYKEVDVYNCSSAELNTVTNQDIFEMGLKLAPMLPLNETLWLPGGTMTSCKYHHFINVILFQVIPGFFVDAFLKLTNKKTMLSRIQRRIFVAVNVVKFFIINQWTFKNDKLLELARTILDDDKASFDYLKINYDPFEYFKNAMIGGRQYLLNEDLSTLPAAKRNYARMFWLDKSIKFAILLALAYWSVKLGMVQYMSTILRQWWTFLFN